MTGAALTLTDDEATPTATLALSAETIDEHDGSVAGSATVTASLNRASSEAVTLTVAAAAGTNAAAGRLQPVEHEDVEHRRRSDQQHRHGDGDGGR